MSTTAQDFTSALEGNWPEERVRAEITERALRSGESEEALLDGFALELAENYVRGSLSHEMAMNKASAVYGALLGQGAIPKRLYEVYWALDQAEFGNEQDDAKCGNAPEHRAREAIRNILNATLRDDA